MIGKKISHYKILEKLGEGGMGVVYRAHDTKLDREVALKFLPDHSDLPSESQDRLLQEARSIAQLNHPNISQIYSIENDSTGNHFIVMEFVNGLDLQKVIESGFELNSEQDDSDNDNRSQTVKSEIYNTTNRILDYSIQIARGLTAAHEKKVVHRDIKPANIIVSSKNEIKILDFGLAKIAGADQLTKVGSTLGTISYMSPEQIRGEELDGRSDIWSFGVVLYQMLTGRLPFGGDYEHSIMYSVINTDPPSVITHNPELPDQMDAVISRCLAKNPDNRYQSATDLLADLSKIANPTETEATSSASSQSGTASLITAQPTFIRNAAIIAGILILGFLAFASFRSMPSWSFGDNRPIHLAVLPFTNIGNDPGRQVFSDGLVETITSNLSQMERFQNDLWVVPSGEIRSQNILSAGEAYKMFGANYAVAGSIQPLVETLRLTITLIDSENLRQINSAVIDVDAKNVLELHNRSVESLLAMLNLEFNTESRTIISEGATNVPKAFEYYLEGLGYLQRFERLENINLAIEKLEQSTELDPKFALAYAGLGQAYWRKFENTNQTEWVDRAIEQSQAAKDLNSNLVQVNVTLGIINLGTGNYNQAISNFSDALNSDPTNADAYRGLAQAYEYSGSLDEAESTYRQAIRLKPDYWAGYNALGVYYFRNNLFEKAKEQFQRVTELTPDNYRGYMNLGSMNYYTGQLDEARLMYEKSLELEKTYGAASNLATLYYSEGRYSESARMYETALKINDSNYLIWGNLASAYYWSPGEQEKAIPNYKRAIELAKSQLDVNPNDAEINVTLGGYLAMIGEAEQAVSYIEKAIRLAPESSSILYLAGTGYERLGDREKALTLIINAIQRGYPEFEVLNQPELKDLINDARYKEMQEKATP